jgi:phage terminase small subunit
LAPRPRRRPAHSASSEEDRPKRRKGSSDKSEADREGIIERAARLGVTPERVLQEYARIAFADLRRFADWGPEGLVLKTPESLRAEDAAAISEITTAGAKSGAYRLKLYDKKAALDAIARHLGMFAPTTRGPSDDPAIDVAEDPREVLARRLARLAAGSAEE